METKRITKVAILQSQIDDFNREIQDWVAKGWKVVKHSEHRAMLFTALDVELELVGYTNVQS